MRMSHERVGRMLAGASTLAILALGYLHHPAWLLLAAGIALNLFVSGITDRCPVKSLLIRLGLPGERDLGRADAERVAVLAQPAEETKPRGREVGAH